MSSVVPVFKKSQKMSLGNSLKYSVLLMLLGFLWTRCSDDQLFRGNARIQTTFHLKSSSALGGSVTIQEAYLKLSSLGVTGALGNENLPATTYSVAPEEPPYKLTQSDSAHVTLTLPSRAYDLLDLSLLLFQSKYQLVTLPQAQEPTPQPVPDDNDGATGGNGGTGGEDDPADNEGGQTDGGQDNGSDKPNGNDDEGKPPGSNGDSNDPVNDNDQQQEEDNDDDGEKDDKENDDGNDEGKANDESKNHGKNDDGDKEEKGKDDDDEKDDNDKDGDDDDEKDDNDKDDDDDKDDSRVRGEAGGTVDLDDFFQNAKPSLVVFATWVVNGENINIVFAVTDAERITIRATQNGNHRLRLANHGTAWVAFDPDQWFKSISTTDLQNASRQTYQGRPVVFIHHDHNTALFDALYSNLVKSTTFEFSIPSVE